MGRITSSKSLSSFSTYRNQRDSWESGFCDNDFIIGLFVPTNGAAGIWGPSSIACAQLAQAELNRSGGILGRRVRLRVIDASDEAVDVGDITRALVQKGELDAIVGMHTSQVRQRILNNFSNEIPFIYTPVYEGGEYTPGVYTLGETPEQQLLPAIEHMVDKHKAKNWLFIGNDYVWPRVSHRIAKKHLHQLGGRLLADLYVPLGTEFFDKLIEDIRLLAPDIVLLSLVGQDAIDFNRAFGNSGLSNKIIRLSTVIEENELLAIGANNTDSLFVVSGYFAGIDSKQNMIFKEDYYSRFGDRAPTLNALGQSTYEGVHFLNGLVRAFAEIGISLGEPLPTPLVFKSVRGIRYDGNGRCQQPTYLAKAKGHFFQKPLTLNKPKVS